MATVRISQLTAITTPTDDDILIINDADTNTRKITYANLTKELLNTSSSAQTKSGNLSVGGLTVEADFSVDTDVLHVDSTNNRVGVNNPTPDVDLDINGSVRSEAFQFADSDASNYVEVKSPATVSANFTLTLPETTPSATNLLTVSAAGTMGYSTGVTFDSSDSSLSFAVAKLLDQGPLRFFEEEANGTNYIEIKAPGLITNNSSYELPNARPPASGYVLTSTTSGVLSWTSAGTPAGGAAEIQYNNGSGNFASSSNFIYEPGTLTMSAPNIDVSTAAFFGGIARTTTASTTDIGFGATADIILGEAANYSSFKVLIHAVDTITGETEFYEHFITHDGVNVSEITGTNVQSTPGTFLSAPATAISVGNDVVLSIENTAASNNNIRVKVNVTSITA